ncbi:hypothetical protein ACFVYG_39570 [Streptomyces sp. NPDC058256]|uniref:5'-methylthioadenosine/S-adenosylhomocysteine nucleosidase family protein n=1 Tax=Streptomyces sp. NPDC058256 TaxID=3346408 RepID=UPI0036ED6C2B
MDASADTVVVLTALPLERQAVRLLLEDLERVDHAGTVFERGRLTGTPWTVCLAVTGAGNDSAAAITERAVSYFRPQAVFFTGIAGSLKPDVSPGDVVVALEVYAYHGGKEDPEGFKVRSRSWETSHSLQQVAMYADDVTNWRARLPEAARTTTKVHFKPIAAGDRVLNSPAGSPPRAFLDQNYNDAVAVDMEGAGFASAAHKAGVPHLMVRGISDWADGTKQSTDSAGTREAAADHAALFLAAVIAQLRPANSPSGPKLPTAPGPTTGELIWQSLDQPAGVAWFRDLLPTDAYSYGPARLELHLVPVLPANRVPATRMRQLANELVSLGRSEGLFTNAENVEVYNTAEMTVVAVADRRGRSAGLAITRSGQRSAWESLPKPGITYVLDEEHTRDRIGAFLALLQEIEGPTSPSYALALGIDNPKSVTVERLSEVNPQRASGIRRTDAPVRVEPDEAVTASAVAGRVSDLADRRVRGIRAAAFSAISRSGSRPVYVYEVSVTVECRSVSFTA